MPRPQKLLLLALALVSSDAVALNGLEGASSAQGLPRSVKSLTLHPFGAATLAKPNGLALFEAGAISLDDAVRRLVQPELHPSLEMRIGGLDAESAALSRRSTTVSHDVRFELGGVPVCNTGMRVHALADGRMLILGTAPDLDPAVRGAPRDPSAWPEAELATQRVAEELGDGTVRTKAASRCLEIVNGEPLPVWELELVHAGLPYHAVADGYEVRRLENAFFDAVDGTAKVYEHNFHDAVKTEYPLPGLVGDGTLSSERLRSVVPSIFPRITEPSHLFDYPDEDVRFVELSTFAHATVHFDYFVSHGFEFYGPYPILIKTHVAPGGQRNNALFIPGDGVGLPEIQIDDGDGKDLQNLGLDADVVSHELGHHVVYRTLRTTSGQSLALHEGLADFFAFSRTGDPCLGETICPASSGACIQPGQCLRTAASTVRFGDANWESWKRVRSGRVQLGHLHGQLVSGTLWDLRLNLDIPADELTSLVIKAVGFFKFDSGFRDWLLAMLMADAELFQGKYFPAIKARAEARGLGEFLTGIDQAQALPPLEGKGGETPAAVGSGPNALPSPSSPGERKETQGDENPFVCGVAGDGSSTATAIALILGLLLPLLAAANQPKRAKAPARKPQPKDAAKKRDEAKPE